MHFKWSSIGCCCNNYSTDTPTDTSESENENRPVSESELRCSSTSFWSATYDRAVRTDSYHQVMMRLEMLSKSDYDAVSDAADRLLQPSQATVETVLAERSGCERPDILRISMEYFESNQRASRLCGALLHSIHEARAQCPDIIKRMLPHSGQIATNEETSTLLHIDRPCKGAPTMKNPFADDATSSQMFADVWERYNNLGKEVAERKRVVGIEMRGLKRWRRGCIVGIVVVGVATGVVVIAVVSTIAHVVSSVGVPVAVAATLMRVHSCKHKQRGDGGGGRQDGKHKGRWGRGRYKEKLRALRMQEVKLEALARGSFIVRRMLDTLRCLVVGLQEDVERERRLVKFGWAHREERVWVEQVAHHLHRNHLHFVEQLDNLEEQVVVCFVIINKTRDWVLQEFFGSPLTPSS